MYNVQKYNTGIAYYSIPQLIAIYDISDQTMHPDQI